MFEMRGKYVKVEYIGLSLTSPGWVGLGDSNDWLLHDSNDSILT
jgi:hypothetical protein